jgi:hypothetical protein
MILELGVNTWIHVTAQYSNAVLVAVLPYFTDVAKKLDLPVPIPITQTDIAKVNVWPGSGAPGASILLKNDWSFQFLQGYVCAVQKVRDELPFGEPAYGSIKITTEDAVKTARDALKKLGVAPEDVFSDFEPKVTPPNQIGTNVTFPYQIEWLDEWGSRTVDIRVDPHTGKIERLYIHHFNLERPPPKIGVEPSLAVNANDFVFRQMPPPPINPEYAWKLIPIMFRAIDEYGAKLSLPVPRPLTTNHVAKVEVDRISDAPYCDIWLTNGWRFIYSYTMVNGYDTPDRLGKRGPMHIKDFAGKWNLTTNQAIEVVKKALGKVVYPTNNIHMDFEPTVILPAGEFRKVIPRYIFEWYYRPSGQGNALSRVEAEVNADNGKLESIFYDDEAYHGSRPLIDVPISIK